MGMERALRQLMILFTFRLTSAHNQDLDMRLSILFPSIGLSNSKHISMAGPHGRRALRSSQRSVVANQIKASLSTLTGTETALSCMKVCQTTSSQCSSNLVFASHFQLQQRQFVHPDSSAGNLGRIFRFFFSLLW